MLKFVNVYDMDGTIVDSSHRYRTIETENGPRIDLEYWRENEYRAMEDGLLPLAQQYMRDLHNPEVYVIIATARVMNNESWQFVDEILGRPDILISRPADYVGSGADIKARALRQLKNLRQFQGLEWVFYEDNIQYLKKVCDSLQCRGVYVPSVQGH